MSNETAWDHDAVVGAANTARDGLPTISNVANDGGGISPLISGAANEGNTRTTDELGKARGDADKTEKASKNLNDSDIEGGKSLEDVDTELSSDHAGGAKPSLASLGGSPTGGGGSPAGGAPMAAPAAPTPPQMPPMQMPQTPQTGNFSMPASMMSNLMKNFDPDKAAAANKDTAMAANGIKEGKISPSDVKFDKTHMGALSKSKLHAVIDRALDLNGIPKDPKVRAQWHEVMTFMAKHESSYNPDAVNLTDCLPISNSILTKRGWLKHDEVKIGDVTIGFNLATGMSEWTNITNVVHYSDANLVRMFNARWSSECTPNHRWLVTSRETHKVDITSALTSPDKCSMCTWPEGVLRYSRSTKGGLRVHMGKAHGVKSVSADAYSLPRMKTFNELNSRDSIILAAKADTKSSLSISMLEAELLGWIAGDGHVEKRKHRPTISIAQSKPKMVERLKLLLANVPHSTYMDIRKTRTGKEPCGPRYQFRLLHEWAVDLMQRVGHPKYDAMDIVLSMSSAERGAWLRGITDAEGHVGKDGKAVLSQCYGPVLDAIVAATYLEGFRPSVLDRNVSVGGWNASALVYGNIPRVNVGMLSMEESVPSDVWCVTTDLGTWTARNGEHVFLTGNSNARGARAADGHPGQCSRGIWQTIPTTFAAHHVPGTSANIYDPLSSAAASIRYSMSRYGINPEGGASLQRFYADRMRGGYTGY